MKPKKKFDCVQMKNEIQAKILKQLEGLSPEQARQAKRSLVEKDPVLADFAKRMTPSPQTVQKKGK